MFHNRISSQFPAETPAAATPAPAVTGFALIPFSGPIHAVMAQFAALQQAYREQLALAERRAVQQVVRRVVEAQN